MSVSGLFQTRGAVTANDLSLSFLRVRGRNRLPPSVDRDEARDGRSATGLIRSAMYCGACPTSALWTSRLTTTNYTVSGKKEATLFSTTTLAFLGRFL